MVSEWLQPSSSLEVLTGQGSDETGIENRDQVEGRVLAVPYF